MLKPYAPYVALRTKKDRAEHPNVVVLRVTPEKVLLRETHRMGRSTPANHHVPTDPPGVNIYYMRLKRGWTQRELGEACEPQFDHSTIARMEKNGGYRSETLARVAKALGTTANQLMLPPEVLKINLLSPARRARIRDIIDDAIATEEAERQMKAAEPKAAYLVRRKP